MAAPQTILQADAIMKDLYVGPIVEQLNYKTYMLDQIERDSDHIDHTGKRAIVPVHTDRNHGRGSRGDGGGLPTAGLQTWQDAIINIRYHYYGIEVTDASIEASQSNQGAFISILDAETKGVAKDMRKDINRQVFGTGVSGTNSGLLAAVSATTNGLAAGTAITLTSVQYVQVGDPVDILTVSTATTGGLTGGATGNTVATRTGGTTKTITLSVTVTGSVTGGTSTPHGIFLASAAGFEMDGLRQICATTRTLHSISTTSSNLFWNGVVKDATSAVAGESLFEQLADDVGLNGNGEVEAFLTSRGVRRRLADTYQSQKRFNDARAVDIHGGYSAIMVNEIPVVADDDCPRGFAFGVNRASFKWFEQTTPGWLQNGGGIFELKDGGTSATKVAAWQAWFRWYAALGCIAPNRNGVIINCADDNPA